MAHTQADLNNDNIVLHTYLSDHKDIKTISDADNVFLILM